MKKIGLFSVLMTMALPALATANTDAVIAAALGKYSTADAGQTCSVLQKAGGLTIHRNADGKDFEVSFDRVVVVDPSVIQVNGKDFNGQNEVYLLATGTSLKVIALRHDASTGLDSAASCALAAK